MEQTSNLCQLMVSLNVAGVTGLPQLKCGALIPRYACPFAHDRNTCPYRTDGTNESQ